MKGEGIMFRIGNRSREGILAILITVFAIGAIGTAGLSSTGCKSVDPGSDPVVVNAERSEKIAFDTIDAFLKLESQNRAEFATLVPGVTETANDIRRKLKGSPATNTPGVFTVIDQAIDKYRAAKKSAAPDLTAQETALQAALAGVSSLVQSATQLIAAWSSHHPTAHFHLVPPIRGPDSAGIFLGAVSFATVAGWILPVLAGLATALGGPGLGTLVGRVAQTLLDAGDKIAEDAHQTGEMTDEELAAWRAKRDDIIANGPEFKESTSPGA
jgi:hypothetical protein